jgi:diguanylate cyclase (GGDEF)-like protein
MMKKLHWQWVPEVHSGAVRLAAGVFAAVAVSLVALLCRATGGPQSVYSHTMYVPIVVTGYVLGVPFGVLTGLVGGFVLGPYMPPLIEEVIAQHNAEWLYRLAMFALVGCYSGVFASVVSRKVSEQEWIAEHDQYTGLPNRRRLIEAIQRLLADASTKALDAWLVTVVASNLPKIDAVVGFDAGDRLMADLGDRLVEALPGSAQVYHYHPERLAAVISKTCEDTLDSALEKLYQDLQRPFRVGDLDVHVDCHVGCTMLDSKEPLDPAAVLKSADQAARLAQDDGIGYRMGTPSIDGFSEESLEILGALQDAIDTNELYLEYQPKYDLASRRIVGVEALVRWDHPTRGLLPPHSFVPQAEQSTLIDALTRWVFSSAVLQLAEWRDQGLWIPIAINISTRNLYSSRLAGLLPELLEAHQLPPEGIELEITEGALMKSPERAMEVLTQLAAAPFVIAIDDFGTGFSSLQYLGRIPASVIKLDQVFVAGMLRDPSSRRIVEGTIDLAHRLGMKVVAEGIEDEPTATSLSAAKCDYGQGFHLGRPASADRIADLYRENQASVGDLQN